MAVILYGISNCDSVRKARKWLQAEAIEFEFRDFRKHGLSAELLAAWVDELGWETLLNKRGTTWRKLADDVKATVDENSACKLMLEEPTLIKRPVLTTDKNSMVGFSAEAYQQLFS